MVSRLARPRNLDDNHEPHKDYIEGVYVQLLGWVQMRVFGANVLCRGMPNETGERSLRKEMKPEAIDSKLKFSTLSFNMKGTKLLQACLPCSHSTNWMIATRMPVSYFAKAASLARVTWSLLLLLCITRWVRRLPTFLLPELLDCRL